jgi:hypothetical protein
MKDIVIFFLIRTCIILFAFCVGYLFVFKAMQPYVLDKLCFTNTDKCNSLQIYRYKNTFLARDTLSQIYFWYNGNKLFIYGQIDGKCEVDDYVPVTVFSLSNVKDIINFTILPNECIYKVDKIIDMYKTEYSAIYETIYVKNTSSDITNNIFNVIQTLYNNKIINI